MNSLVSVSIVIPTYKREKILIQTLNELLELEHKALEILVVDQSPMHEEAITKSLQTMHASKRIRWIKLTTPSIPNAMNVGALEANGDVVLYLDDDIQVPCEIVLEHAKEYNENNVNAVAGQVIQSWEEALSSQEPSFLGNKVHDPDSFRFNSSKRANIRRFMGGNISFKVSDLIDSGGFDTNFTKVAYRFEAECAERFTHSGKRIIFQPKASIFHLKELSGGTRAFGDHKTTIKPSHSVGRYYYYLVVKNQHNRWLRFLTSPFFSCATRFHLRNPWYIPVTFIAEISGMIWASYLSLQGQKLIPSTKYKRA